LYFW